MDGPQIKSILTSILLMGSTSVAAWAAHNGLIPSGDQSVIANDLVMAASTGVAALLAWYKARANSQSAMIATINKTDNGVKVVADTVPAPTETAPLK